MKISIALRYKPFSHTPGNRFVIPGSGDIVQIFPTKIVINSVFEIALNIKGPVNHFTSILNLEKKQIEVSGKDQSVFFRYIILPGKIEVKKGEILSEKTVTFTASPTQSENTHFERASFGCHKKQDVDAMRNRKEMVEYLPFIFALSQHIPPVKKPSGEGRALDVLDQLKKTVFEGDKREIDPLFKNVFCALFTDGFVPQFTDPLFQGIIDEKSNTLNGSPLYILQECGKCVRALFFRESDNALHFLPNLPPQIHSGRVVGIKAANGDLIEIEWSKKQLKKVIICPAQTGKRNIRLVPALRRFRLRTSQRQKGTFHNVNDPILVVKGKTILLDRFQK